MLRLIETLIGFAAIMLVLSYLVKCLASKAPWIKDISWKRLGDSFLDKKNMEWILNKLGDLADKKIDLEGIEARLEVHLSNIKYAFEKRIKNIAVVVGLAVCLALKMRSEFAGSYAEAALALVEQNEEEAGYSEPPDVEGEREELKKRTDAILDQLKQFQADVSFGIGRIWRDPPKEKDWLGFLYEFMGSLLTGIFISIGAPYWHDLLRALAGIRQRKKKPAPEEKT